MKKDFILPDIGEGIAEIFAAAGAQVTVADRDGVDVETFLARLRRETRYRGGEACSVLL